jgi:hypothetical protein
MPGFTEIENYEPSDEGWAIVAGRFVRPKPEGEHEHDFVDPGDGQTTTLKASSHRRTLWT